MQLISQTTLLRTPVDECFHSIQFGGTSRLKTTRVVKNETWVASEYHCVLDVVQSALTKRHLPIKDRSWQPTFAEGATTDASICMTIINIDLAFRSHITRLFALAIINLGLFRRVTDFLKDSRLSRVGSPYGEDTEAVTHLSDPAGTLLVCCN